MFTTGLDKLALLHLLAIYPGRNAVLRTSFEDCSQERVNAYEPSIQNQMSVQMVMLQ